MGETSRLAWVGLLLSGCFFPADRGRLVESRLETLSSENRKLKDELDATRTDLDKATGQLAQALEQLDKSSRTSGANIGVKVDAAVQEAAQLKGQVEALTYRLNELEGRLNAPPPARPEEPKKEEPRRPDTPVELLALAEATAARGENEQARRLFSDYLRRFPREEGAGEAHFGLAETHLADKHCREALYEYGKVLEDFPRSRSAPRAYLRSSECFKELKLPDESRLALEELLKQHPRSDAATEARARLKELDKKKKGAR